MTGVTAQLCESPSIVGSVTGLTRAVVPGRCLAELGKKSQGNCLLNLYVQRGSIHHNSHYYKPLQQDHETHSWLTQLPNYFGSGITMDQSFCQRVSVFSFKCKITSVPLFTREINYPISKLKWIQDKKPFWKGNRSQLWNIIPSFKILSTLATSLYSVLASLFYFTDITTPFQRWLVGKWQTCHQINPTFTVYFL